MQVGAVKLNSINFKCRDCKTEYSDFSDYYQEGADIVRTASDVDDFCKNKKDPEKKNFFLSMASLCMGGLLSYKLGKGFAKTTEKIVSESEIATKLLKSAAKATQKGINGLCKNKNEYLQLAGKKLQKGAYMLKGEGKYDAVGIASGIVGLTKLVDTDSNNDGIADILQKDVNAYSGALKDVQLVTNTMALLA